MQLARAFPPLGFLNVPNVVTSLAATAGILAVLLARSAGPRVALTLLFAAILLDRLDGALARKLGTSTELGGQLDSLADAIDFCAAPVAIAHAGGFDAPLAVVSLVVYVLAGLWRLAYFNLTGTQGEGKAESYIGLPTTVAASYFLILSAAFLWFAAKPAVVEAALGVFFILAAVLMVSSFTFAKRGLLARSLYVLLPLSLVAVWLA